MGEWTFAQKGLVVLAALQLLWATAGLIAEPSFHIGADAPTDGVFHLATGTLFAAVAAIQLAQDRAARAHYGWRRHRACD